MSSQVSGHSSKGSQGQRRHRVLPLLVSGGALPLAYLMAYLIVTLEYRRDSSWYIGDSFMPIFELLALAFGGVIPAVILHLMDSPSGTRVLKVSAASLMLLLLAMVLLAPGMLGPLAIFAPAFVAAHILCSSAIHSLMRSD